HDYFAVAVFLEDRKHALKLSDLLRVVIALVDFSSDVADYVRAKGALWILLNKFASGRDFGRNVRRCLNLCSGLLLGIRRRRLLLALVVRLMLLLLRIANRRRQQSRSGEDSCRHCACADGLCQTK